MQLIVIKNNKYAKKFFCFFSSFLKTWNMTTVEIGYAKTEYHKHISPHCKYLYLNAVTVMLFMTAESTFTCHWIRTQM